MTSPVGVDKLARFSEQLIGVGTKVVTLGLDQVGRDTLAPTSKGERESECMVYCMVSKHTRSY